MNLVSHRRVDNKSAYCPSRSFGMFQHNDSIKPIVNEASWSRCGWWWSGALSVDGERWSRMILNNVASILAGECLSGDDSKNDENEGNEYDK